MEPNFSIGDFSSGLGVEESGGGGGEEGGGRGRGGAQQADSEWQIPP